MWYDWKKQRKHGDFLVVGYDSPPPWHLTRSCSNFRRVASSILVFHLMSSGSEAKPLGEALDTCAFLKCLRRISVRPAHGIFLREGPMGLAWGSTARVKRLLQFGFEGLTSAKTNPAMGHNWQRQYEREEIIIIRASDSGREKSFTDLQQCLLSLFLPPPPPPIIYSHGAERTSFNASNWRQLKSTAARAAIRRVDRSG